MHTYIKPLVTALVSNLYQHESARSPILLSSLSAKKDVQDVRSPKQLLFSSHTKFKKNLLEFCMKEKSTCLVDMLCGEG